MQNHKHFFFLILVLISSTAWAQKSKEQNEKKETFSLGKMKNVPDVELFKQDGEKVNFHQLIKGKVVALNFIFTTCKTDCPAMGANFVGLKRLMSDKVKSSELVMLSISIDPQTDTPERLKAWSKKFDAGPGWTLVTGKRQEVFELLKRLGVYSAVKEEHAPLVLLGKEGTDNWIRTNGLSDPKQLAKILNGLF
jgi:protein SCO1